MDQMPPTTEGPPPVPESSSLLSRMVNVFAAPDEVFEEVKRTPKTAANWLVPAIISAVVGVVAAVVLFSQPTILRQMQEGQTRVMEKQVQDGKMTQEQADKATEAMEKIIGPMMMVIGAVGAVAVSFGRVFWWGLVMMLIAKWFLKSQIRYLKAVEIAGLASLIITLGGVVQTLLAVFLGKMATVSLTLLLKEFDFTSKLHFMLGAVNLFKLWAIVVLGAGLARLAGVSWAKATLLMLVYWVVWSLVLIGINMGQFTL